jgi:hypothetical protein
MLRLLIPFVHWLRNLIEVAQSEPINLHHRVILFLKAYDGPLVDLLMVSQYFLSALVPKVECKSPLAHSGHAYLLISEESHAPFFNSLPLLIWVRALTLLLIGQA